MAAKEKQFDDSSFMAKSKRMWFLTMDIVLFLVLFFFINTLFATPLSIVFEGISEKELLQNIPLLMAQETIMMIAIFIAAFVVLRIRKSSLGSIGLSFRGKDILWGVAFAVGLYMLGFAISLVLGVVKVTSVHVQPYALFMTLLFFLLVAITEEVAMRGFVLGHLLDNGVSKFWALLVSAVLFSLMHLLNPNFELLPFINIVLAGFLLGASYLYTRNLCFPIALHWFWNWIQGPVLGYEVSGNQFGDSLFTLHLSGEKLLNGGAFGFEGSAICSVLMVLGTGLIIGYYSRKS